MFETFSLSAIGYAIRVRYILSDHINDFDYIVHYDVYRLCRSLSENLFGQLLTCFSFKLVYDYLFPYCTVSNLKVCLFLWYKCSGAGLVLIW